MKRAFSLLRWRTRASAMDNLLFIGIIVGWILLQYVVLPRMGVPT
jgi:hypothetical protein